MHLLLCIREILIERNEVNVRNMGRVFVKSQSMFNMREHVLVEKPTSVKNVEKTLAPDISSLYTEVARWWEILKNGRNVGKLTSLVAQMVKRLPTMRETQVRSLGWEDPLEKEMATHSSTLAWKIPWMEERGRLQSMGLQRIRHDWATSLHFSLC